MMEEAPEALLRENSQIATTVSDVAEALYGENPELELSFDAGLNLGFFQGGGKCA